jgi:hypothetical protein
MLELQFRSHPTITGFSSNQFYGSRIQSAKECSEKLLALRVNDYNLIKCVADSKPLCYIDMKYYNMPYDNPVEWFPPRDFSQQKHVQPSCLNRYEATIALKARHDLIRGGLPPENIWIITPYRLQREVIRRAIRKIYGSVAKEAIISISENLTASTVDSIQGKENDVVIYVLTWSPRFGSERQIHAALCDYRRLNVAMTRAKKKLIIVGDISRLSQQYPYSALQSYLEKNATVIQAPKLSESDDFLTVVTRCYDEKRKVINPALVEKAKEAKRRIQVSFDEKQPDKKITIYDDKTFDELRSSGEWEDLSFSDKQKCYELRRRKTTFQVITQFDEKTKRKSLAVVEAKTWAMQGNLRRKETDHLSTFKTETAFTPITTQDFMECGAVNNYLKSHPEASDNEVAANTKLPLNRVTNLRTYLNKPQSPTQQNNAPAQFGDPVLARSESNRHDMAKQHLYQSDTKPQFQSAVSSPRETPIEKCDECARKISLEEYNKYEGICRDCYYRKLSGDVTRNQRNAGLLGKDRTY